MTSKKDTEYHIGRDQTDPGRREQVEGHLENTETPGVPGPRGRARPRERSESLNFIEVTSKMGLRAGAAESPLQLLDPESTLRLLSQSHMDYFGDDFRAARDEFIRLRFHVGQWGDVFEFYSDSFPLTADTWGAMREPIADHIRSELSELEERVVKRIPVRMVFFHIPTVHAPLEYPGEVLKYPLDFATTVGYTVEEFVGYESYGRRPSRFRLSFDASYLYLGADTGAAFEYANHWLYFSEVLCSFAELFNRPFESDELPLCILREHAEGKVASLVTGIGLSEKRTYQTHDRVYLPQVDVIFGPDHLEFRLTDKTGILAGLVGHFPAGPYRRVTDGDVTTLTKLY